MTRRTWAALVAVVGAAAVGYGFYLQAQANSSNAVSGMLGLRSQATAAPWVVGGIGALLLLLALILVVAGSPASNQRAVAMGWHDDPNRPDLLRYHDGKRWTDRTAAKD